MDIYDEVFIDEINQELLNSVMRQQGEVVVVLMRQERLKKFTDVWRAANLDYYNTQTVSAKKLKKSAQKILSVEEENQEEKGAESKK